MTRQLTLLTVIALATACAQTEYGSVPGKYALVEVFGSAAEVPESPVLDPSGNVAGIVRDARSQAAGFAWDGETVTDLALVHVAALDPSGIAVGTGVVDGAMQAARAEPATGQAHPLITGSAGSCATALNARGEVFGVDFQRGAFRWTEEADPLWLPGRWFPMAADDKDQAVGVMSDVLGDDVPVRWSEAHGLERLPLGAASAGLALDVAEGTIVGAAGSTPAMWVDGDLVSMDLLPDAIVGVANAINAHGVIVGEDTVAGETRAWVFAGGRKLAIEVEGWTLLTASDVNDAGEIVGTATRDGDPTVLAVLLTPAPLEAW